jgi:hypothetical protein
MQGILVIMVDGSEETPIKVVRDLAAVREVILAEESRYGTPDPEDIELFEENLNEVTPEGRVPEGADLQFESGFGSCDYRLTLVEVDL